MGWLTKQMRSHLVQAGFLARVLKGATKRKFGELAVSNRKTTGLGVLHLGNLCSCFSSDLRARA